MGLPSEYDVLVAMVNDKLQSQELSGVEISVQEVLAMALSQESRIEYLVSNIEVHY